MFAGKFSYASEPIVFSMVFVVGIHICSFFLFLQYWFKLLEPDISLLLLFLIFFFHVALIMSWGRTGSVGKMYAVALKNTARLNVLHYWYIREKIKFILDRIFLRKNVSMQPISLGRLCLSSWFTKVLQTVWSFSSMWSEWKKHCYSDFCWRLGHLIKETCSTYIYYFIFFLRFHVPLNVMDSQPVIIQDISVISWVVICLTTINNQQIHIWFLFLFFKIRRWTRS